jgi:5-methylcytosine-specific restriction endonuclease McrA
MRRANRKARKQNLDKPTKEILDSVAPLSRHIPSQLRDEVFMKEGCQCSYVSPDGVRCQAREQLEIDHIVPFSAGGKTILGNLRLRCRQHNLLAAEQFYGKGKIEQFRRQA